VCLELVFVVFLYFVIGLLFVVIIETQNWAKLMKHKQKKSPRFVYKKGQISTNPTMLINSLALSISLVPGILAAVCNRTQFPYADLVGIEMPIIRETTVQFCIPFYV
jgi:hypothetical protein